MQPDDRRRELRSVLSFPKTRRALAERELQRPYPKLDRKKRRAVRRVFLYGLLHPDAMHYAIWGVNEDKNDELGRLREAVWDWYVARGDARLGGGLEAARFHYAENRLKRLARDPRKEEADVQ